MRFGFRSFGSRASLVSGLEQDWCKGQHTAKQYCGEQMNCGGARYTP